MDRISDSGSEDLGSNPDEVAKLIINNTNTALILFE